MKVDIYRNLHKKVWSVRDCKTRRVVKHVNHAYVLSAELVVGEKSRQRVIREKSKNAHAFVRGLYSHRQEVLDLTNLGLDTLIEISYNPYRFGYFFRTDTLEPVHTSSYVVLQNGRAYIGTQYNKVIK